MERVAVEIREGGEDTRGMTELKGRSEAKVLKCGR
jgi:hypothetical protein